MVMVVVVVVVHVDYFFLWRAGCVLTTGRRTAVFAASSAGEQALQTLGFFRIFLFSECRQFYDDRLGGSGGRGNALAPAVFQDLALGIPRGLFATLGLFLAPADKSHLWYPLRARTLELVLLIPYRFSPPLAASSPHKDCSRG